MKHKKIRKILCFYVLLSVFLSVFAFSICAHSPSSMNLQYTMTTQILTIEITHQVADNTTHFVNSITVWKNDEMYTTKTYMDQPETTQFSYTIDVTASFNDTLRVTANCNLGGSVTQQLIITSNSSDNNNTPSTPGYELIVFGGSMICLLVLFDYKKSTKK